VSRPGRSRYQQAYAVNEIGTDRERMDNMDPNRGPDEANRRVKEMGTISSDMVKAGRFIALLRWTAFGFVRLICPNGSVPNMRGTA
jgi:hypothetical protein